MCGNQEKAACNLSLTRQRGIGIREETNRITLPQIPRKSGSLPRKAVWRSFQVGASSTSGGGSKRQSVIPLYMYRKNKDSEKPGARARNTPFGAYCYALTNKEHSRTRSVRIYVLLFYSACQNPEMSNDVEIMWGDMANQPSDKIDGFQCVQNLTTAITIIFILALPLIEWVHHLIPITDGLWRKREFPSERVDNGSPNLSQTDVW